MHPFLAQLYVESRQHDAETAAHRAQLVALRRHTRPTLRLAFRSSRRG